VWHASLSYHLPGRGIRVDDWSPGQRRLFERELKRLLAGVGAGPRRWEYGSPRAPHVLHVRRGLSDAELQALPPGPPATVPGGDFGGLYGCRHVVP
jgi:hypothetical protein